MKNIQNLLDTMKKIIKSVLLDAGRIEYFCADITPYFIGVCLGLSSLNKEINNFHMKFWIGLLLVILGHYSAVLSNVYSDYELDQRFKPHLPKAVDIIGKKRLKVIFTAISIVGSFVALYLSIFVGNTLLFLFWIIGLLSALIYTLEPFRFKNIPFLGDIARGLPIIITMLFGFYLFSNNSTLILILNFIGIAVNLMGLFLIGEVWDWKDDKGFVKTLAVHYGYLFALRSGIILIMVGLATWLISYYTLYQGIVFEIYFYMGVLFSVAFFIFFLLRVYQKRYEYKSIESICGRITKLGTSLMWLYQLIGAVLVLLFVYI